MLDHLCCFSHLVPTSVGVSFVILPRTCSIISIQILNANKYLSLVQFFSLQVLGSSSLTCFVGGESETFIIQIPMSMSMSVSSPLLTDIGDVYSTEVD